MTKQCKRCGETKAASEFGKRACAKDGLNAACKLCRNTQGRKDYADDPSKQKAAIKAWAEANKDKVREANKIKQRAWSKQNRGKRNAHNAKRRASKLNATPAWLTLEQRAEISSLYVLAQSLGHHVDHIVPLQGELVSGLHVPWNLQVLSPEDNLRKSNKF